MKKDNPEAKSLYDLYRHLNLPVDLIQTTEGFAILNLKDVGFEVPYQSPSFRPDYFSFLFIKDGFGKYTIDEQSFQTKPHSIYFTNPSNYRTFSWEKIEEIYLITFDETFLKKYIDKDVFQDFPIGGKYLFANSSGIYQPFIFKIQNHWAFTRCFALQNQRVFLAGL